MIGYFARGGAALAFYVSVLAGPAAAEGLVPLTFPDTPDGRKVLALDLHMHTVFSDGYVWPTVRVEEAVKEGLAGISITDHLEYQPWRTRIPVDDRNQTYLIAKEAAPKGFLVINGVEITRRNPPGHLGAVFMTDVNALKTDGVVMTDKVSELQAADTLETSYELARIANAQGAFVTWNHPTWLPQASTGLPTLSEFHAKLIAEGLVHGVELSGSESVFQIALDNNLALIATSDVHEKVEHVNEEFAAEFEVRGPLARHRNATLVLAKDNSESRVKQAMFDRATAALEKEALYGREAELAAIVSGALTLLDGGPVMDGDTRKELYRVHVRNAAPIPFLLHFIGRHELFHEHVVFMVPAASDKTLLIADAKGPKDLDDLRFEVLNAYVAPRTNLIIKLEPR